MRGWSGERYNHGLASKGIKTRIANGEFSSTPYKSPEAFTVRYLLEQARYFNNYSTSQDRKYFLYDLLRYKRDYGVEVEKMVGSNQVIVKIDGEVVYNSDYDNLNRKEFTNLVVKIIKKLPIRYGE